MFRYLCVRQFSFLHYSRAAIVSSPALIDSQHSYRKRLLIFYLLLGPPTAHRHQTAAIFLSAKVVDSISFDQLRVQNFNHSGGDCFNRCKLYVLLGKAANYFVNRFVSMLVTAALRYAAFLLGTVLFLGQFNFALRHWYF